MDMSQYISFVYYQKDVPCVYLKHYSGYLRIFCNKIGVVNHVCFKEYLWDSLPEGAEITGNILVYLDKAIFSRKISRREFDAEKYTLKSNKMYMEGIENNVIKVGDDEVCMTYYPFPCISVFHRMDCSYYSVVSDMEDCVAAVKNGIKKCLAQFYYQDGIYSLHASCVQIGSRCDVFLASTRSGKSTLYANLVTNGASHIGDDIVFVKAVDGELYTFGVPILPSIRVAAIPFLAGSVSLEKHIIQDDSDDRMELIELKGVVLPAIKLCRIGSFALIEKGTQCRYIKAEQDMSLKKALIKSMIWHLNVDVDEGMTSMVNLILSSAWKKLTIAPDPYENIKRIL